MKRNLNWKKVWKYSVIFWGVIFVVSLIPIILLSTYNFPCADDLGYSIYTRHAWVDTHNLFSVLGAAGRKVAWKFQNTAIYCNLFVSFLWNTVFD